MLYLPKKKSIAAAAIQTIDYISTTSYESVSSAQLTQAQGDWFVVFMTDANGSGAPYVQSQFCCFDGTCVLHRPPRIPPRCLRYSVYSSHGQFRLFSRYVRNDYGLPTAQHSVDFCRGWIQYLRHTNLSHKFARPNRFKRTYGTGTRSGPRCNFRHKRRPNFVSDFCYLLQNNRN